MRGLFTTSADRPKRRPLRLVFAFILGRNIFSFGQSGGFSLRAFVFPSFNHPFIPFARYFTPPKSFPIMPPHSLLKLFTALLLLLASITAAAAAPSPSSIDTQDNKGDEDVRDLTHDIWPTCKGRQGGTIGGPNSGYFALPYIGRVSDGIYKWQKGTITSNKDPSHEMDPKLLAQVAWYYPDTKKLCIQAGQMAADHNVFVFKINNWKTHEQGQNYAYQINRRERCCVHVNPTFIRHGSTFVVKLQPIN
jgi:hypothetical protein